MSALNVKQGRRETAPLLPINLNLNSVENEDEFDLRGFRLDWVRFQVQKRKNHE